MNWATAVEMKHWRGVTGIFAIMMLFAACTSTPRATRTTIPRPRSPQVSIVSTAKWWRWNAPNCGIAAMARAAGRVQPLGDCAEIFLVPAREVTVRVGEQVDLHMMEVAPFNPLPRSSDSAVIRLVAVTPEQTTGIYRALRPGHATLVANDQYCVGVGIKGERKGNCPVLDLTVTTIHPTGQR